HLIVEEPAGCDLQGSLHGRRTGYPNYPASNAQIMETSRYIDPVNFAPNIKATCLVAMGFVDNTAPPAGVWTAFNEIPGPKEAVPLVYAPHNNVTTPDELAPF